MKHVVRLGQNKFIVLDSYDESSKNRLGSIAIALLALLLATISGAALVGVDLTKINPQATHQTNGTVHRTNR